MCRLPFCTYQCSTLEVAGIEVAISQSQEFTDGKRLLKFLAVGGSSTVEERELEVTVFASVSESSGMLRWWTYVLIWAISSTQVR